MTLQLKVPSMACSACADTISKAVKAVDPAAVIEADPKTKLVQVASHQPDALIKQAIADAGYPTE